MVAHSDNRGFRDWLIQRISAVLVAAYVIWLLVYACLHPLEDFTAWSRLLHSPIFSVITSVVLVVFIAHAWIGLWTVATDYIQPKRVQRSVLVAIGLLLCVYLVYGLVIVWL